MDLSQIKSELSIQDVADVLAEKTKNELKSKYDKAYNLYLLSKSDIILKLSDELDEFWKKSSKYSSVINLFGDCKVEFLFEILERDCLILDSQIKDYLLEFNHIIDGKSKTTFKVIVQIIPDKYNKIHVKLEETFIVDYTKFYDLRKLKQTVDEITLELTKDWKTIFKNNITALKMAEMGITGSIDIPDLPTLKLNQLLDK